MLVHIYQMTKHHTPKNSYLFIQWYWYIYQKEVMPTQTTVGTHLYCLLTRCLSNEWKTFKQITAMWSVKTVKKVKIFPLWHWKRSFSALVKVSTIWLRLSKTRMYLIGNSLFIMLALKIHIPVRTNVPLYTQNDVMHWNKPAVNTNLFFIIKNGACFVTRSNTA